MNQITEAVLTEKIAQLSAAIDGRDAIVSSLVFMVGKGKNVSIGRGVQRQAGSEIESVSWTQLKSSGEIRITVKRREKEGKE